MDSAAVHCCRNFLAGGEFRKKVERQREKTLFTLPFSLMVEFTPFLGIPISGFHTVCACAGSNVSTLLSVISGVLGSALFYKDILREEQMRVEKFGDDYRRYMEQVPRMNLLIGILRYLRQRKK